MQPLSLHHDAAAAQAADLRRSAAAHRRARHHTGEVALRRATFGDSAALARLAQLDETAAPAGDVLLAELDGRLVAALPLAGGEAIADPFVPTQEIVALLRLRAAA